MKNTVVNATVIAALIVLGGTIAIALIGSWPPAKSIVPLRDVPTPVLRTYRSGAKPSGAGKQLSEWYTLCSEPVADLRISSHEFSLIGDRRCNRWSECEAIERSETRVCYRFRMQGHDEPGAPPVAYSEGILSVHYR